VTQKREFTNFFFITEGFKEKY